MARLRGFEPLTRRFVVCYSIQLSYRRTLEQESYWKTLLKLRHHNVELKLLPANLLKATISLKNS